MTRSVVHSGHEPGPRAIQSALCGYRAAGVITVGYTGLSRAIWAGLAGCSANDSFRVDYGPSWMPAPMARLRRNRSSLQRFVVAGSDQRRHNAVSEYREI